MTSVQDPTGQALLSAERAGMQLGLYGRLAASGIFALWYAGTRGQGRGLYIIAGFALLSLLHLWLIRSRRERQWHRFVLAGADALALAFLAITAPLTHRGEVPQIMIFRAYGVSYVFFFLAVSTLSLSPALVLWTGASLVGALWLAFGVIVHSMPHRLSWGDLGPDYTASDYVALLSNPNFIGTGNRIEESLFLMGSAILLAFGAHRARRLVRDEAAAQFARANLARYVSPDLVEDLAAEAEPFGPVRRQMASVLFVDLVGFTAFAERHAPEEVIQHLRAFHDRVAREVFAQGGTLEDFIGDEVVALFGTPQVQDDDAARAIACAEAIRLSIAAWNAARAAEGLAPVRIGIGLHMGEVVVGTTGTEARLKFTVIGDTVNIASRLQCATRDLGCEALYSQAVWEAAGMVPPPWLQVQLLQLRGHQRPVAALALAQGAPLP